MHHTGRCPRHLKCQRKEMKQVFCLMFHSIERAEIEQHTSTVLSF